MRVRRRERLLRRGGERHEEYEPRGVRRASMPAGGRRRDAERRRERDRRGGDDRGAAVQAARVHGHHERGSGEGESGIVLVPVRVPESAEGEREDGDAGADGEDQRVHHPRRRGRCG